MYLKIAIGLVVFTVLSLSTIYFDFFGLGDKVYIFIVSLLVLAGLLQIISTAWEMISKVVAHAKQRKMGNHFVSEEDQKKRNLFVRIFGIYLIIIVLVSVWIFVIRSN